MHRSANGIHKRRIKVYLGHIRRYLEYYEGDESPFRKDLIDAYLLHLFERKTSSHSYINQAISAIKFALKNTSNTEIEVAINRPKEEKKLPEILSQAEV